jgi:hypothetical protein
MPLMVDVLQRPNWYGKPVELGELFILKKNRREATCRLRSHQFGWELRMFIGRDEIVQTQVCRSPDEAAGDWKHRKPQSYCFFNFSRRGGSSWAGTGSGRTLLIRNIRVTRC